MERGANPLLVYPSPARSGDGVPLADAAGPLGPNEIPRPILVGTLLRNPLPTCPVCSAPRAGRF